ncbi:MAG TPA: hypothetical protein VG711_12620, partial [Phycisphaerales bacterium]|nr:hypothetical protein [Phycisphaerales bacterium]
MWIAIRNQIVLWGGVIAAGLVCWQAAPHLRDSRGAMGPLVIFAEPQFGGIASVVIVIAISTAIACVVGKVVNAAVGWFVLGAGMYGLDYQLESVRETAFAGHTLQFEWVETGIMGIVLLGAVWIIWRVSGPLHDVHSIDDEEHPHEILSSEALKGLLATAVAIPVYWVIARSPLKGQDVCAAFVGGMVGGLFGRLASPNVQPILIGVGPIFMGAIAQAVSVRFMHGTLDAAYVKGLVPPLNMVT